MTADDHDPGHRSPQDRTPLLAMFPHRLVTLVGWVVGLTAIGAGIWLGIWVLTQITVVVVSCAVAVFFVALLMPLNRALQRIHVIPGLAAVLSVLALVLVLAGVGFLAEASIAHRSDQLIHDFEQILGHLRHRLRSSGVPFGEHTVSQLQHELIQTLKSRSHELTVTLVKATRLVIDLVIGGLLGLFVVIFLLYDGNRVWAWFRGLFPPTASQRLKHAGDAAWVALTGFIQGSVIIACIHSVVIGTTMWLLGVSIFLPLAMLVFISSFVPIVGAVVAGGFAVVITLGTSGFVPAIILLAVLLVENEAESHILQPFVVGRYIRLHSLAIVVVLTLASYAAGLWGLLFAVPAAGVLRAVWGPLNGKPSVAPVGQPSRLSRLRDRLLRRRTSRG